jgi:hypothetical protein
VNMQIYVQVVMPYIAEENRDEAPEVQVKPNCDTAAARAVKDAIFNARSQVLPVVAAVSESSFP